MTTNEGMTGIAIIGLRHAERPDATALVAAAAQLGIEMTATDGDTFAIAGGGTLSLTLVDKPLPQTPVGPTSVLPDEAAAVAAHLVLKTRLEGSAIAVDTKTAALAASVVACAPSAIGVLLGTVLHAAAFFTEIVRQCSADGEHLPAIIAADITSAYDQPDQQRMSLLTHRLPRYGCENLYVTCRRDDDDAIDFLTDVADWRIAEPQRQVRDNELVGRSAAEKVRVQRVPNPARKDATVWKLELR